MDKLQDSLYLGNLFNFYKNLLTQKQQDIFISHYFNDIGLTEISQNLNITRQAVLDCLKKTNKSLIEFENKLKLFKIYSNQLKVIENIKQTKDLKKIDNIISFWED